MRERPLRQAIAEKRMVKIIAGIANFDVENVVAIARAAAEGGADAVDVAARPEIVKAVRQATDLPVFASCVSPENLLAAVEAGADAVELGNYDALYEEGLFLSAADVLTLARDTMTLLNGRALVCVTIPGHLSLESQAALATELEALGVDLVQTEGAARVLSETPQVKRLSAGEKAAMSLHNTAILVQHTRLPLMSASGLGPDNTAKALACGAAAVGIGSAVNKLATYEEMVAVVKAVVAAAAPVAAMSQVS